MGVVLRGATIGPTLMTAAKRKQPDAPDGTTRSPADRDIFNDDGAAVPVEDRPRDQRDDASQSSAAGGPD